MCFSWKLTDDKFISTDTEIESPITEQKQHPSFQTWLSGSSHSSGEYETDVEDEVVESNRIYILYILKVVIIPKKFISFTFCWPNIGFYPPFVLTQQAAISFKLFIIRI